MPKSRKRKPHRKRKILQIDPEGRCARCRWQYPEDLLSPLMGGTTRGNICGICARAVRAEIHGVDLPFRPGTQAEMMEDEAIDWRKTHPNNGPRTP